MKISICMPTYNRGNRALESVNKLLEFPYAPDSLEIIVSDNGSDRYNDEYDQIKNITDERLKYHRFDENMGFMRNVNQVIRMSDGDYCMMLSDEDEVDPDIFDYYYDQLKLHPDISILRPATIVQYTNLEYVYATTVEDAIDNFFMEGNYISGTFFNRKLLSNDLIDMMEKRYKDDRAYNDYPHMYYGNLLLLNGSFLSDKYILIKEGEAVDDSTFDEEKKKQGVNIQHYGTYEVRMEQMKDFARLINDIDIEFARKFQMLKILCFKTSYLIEIVKPMYLRIGEDWNKIIEREIDDLKKMIRYVELPLDEDRWSSVEGFVDEIVEIVEKKWG